MKAVTVKELEDMIRLYMGQRSIAQADVNHCNERIATLLSQKQSMEGTSRSHLGWSIADDLRNGL